MLFTYNYIKEDNKFQVDMANSGSGKYANSITFIFNDLGIEYQNKFQT